MADKKVDFPLANNETVSVWALDQGDGTFKLQAFAPQTPAGDHAVLYDLAGNPLITASGDAAVAANALEVVQGIINTLGTVDRLRDANTAAGTTGLGVLGVATMVWDGTNFWRWKGDARAPQPIITHRSAISAADGTTKPLPNVATWAANPGRSTKCRVFVSTTGSPTACTLRPYLRSGGSTGQVGSGTLVQLAGTPNYDASFDVQADGDDLLIFIETLSGGTTPTVTVSLSWR